MSNDEDDATLMVEASNAPTKAKDCRMLIFGSIMVVVKDEIKGTNTVNSL